MASREQQKVLDAQVEAAPVATVTKATVTKASPSSTGEIIRKIIMDKISTEETHREWEQFIKYEAVWLM
jgi:hypothetical protein